MASDPAGEPAMNAAASSRQSEHVSLGEAAGALRIAPNLLRERLRLDPKAQTFCDSYMPDEEIWVFRGDIARYRRNVVAAAYAELSDLARAGTRAAS